MATRDTRRKRPKKPDTTESSSSEETEPLKVPKDVLGLGRHLVRELGLEDGVDTLGRWMAHHVAELIDKAEHGVTEVERARARENATETILKIWEHRASLPGHAYPLAPYREILKVLDRLRPNDNPFRYVGHHAETKKEKLTADLFDDLSRLTIAMLLMKLPPGGETTNVGNAVLDALSETEQCVLTALQQWSELFSSTSKSSGRTRKDKGSSGGAAVDLNEVAIGLIDGTMTTLVELRNELQEETVG